ncbi:MAG: hypothetical protein U0Z44_19985 [Kouleothrix sp.]
MDEPCSALDPIATLKIEELMMELPRVHDRDRDAQYAAGCARLRRDGVHADGPGHTRQPTGRVQTGSTQIFTHFPHDRRTEDYVTGRFG